MPTNKKKSKDTPAVATRDDAPPTKPYQLCPTCSALNITTKSFEVTRTGPKPTWQEQDLGLFEEVVSRTSCSLCRLVTHVVATEHEEGVLLSSTSPKGQGLRCKLRWWDYFAAEHEYGLDDNDKFPGLRCLHVICTLPDIGELPALTLVPVASDGSNLYYGRTLPPECDVRILRAWTSRCEAWHGTKCDELVYPGVAPPWTMESFLLVDLHNKCLVRKPASWSATAVVEMKYAAVSYVWGAAESFCTTVGELSALLEPNSLLKRMPMLPATIRDALKLAATLGLDYVWVDQLCIVQDDAASSDEAIGHMDRIYAHAYLTIIAASGDNAYAGLPGVAGRPRAAQVIETVGDSDLQMMAQPTWDSLIKRSVYETRAWTYQERVLSRRCLYFFPTHTVFQCQCISWREDAVLDDNRIKLHDFKNSAPVGTYGKSNSIQYLAENDQSGDRQGPLHDYETVVREYSMRKFTYDTDALRACSGILGFVATLMGVTLHFGLPQEFMDLFLLWYPSSRSSSSSKELPDGRRKGFPSWSWAGWTTPTFPSLYFGHRMDIVWWHGTDTWIQWCNFDVEPLPTLEKTEYWQEDEDIFKGMPRRLKWTDLPRIPWQPPNDKKQKNRMSLTQLVLEDESPKIPFSRTTHLLRFSTLALRLTINTSLPIFHLRNHSNPCFDLSDACLPPRWAGRIMLNQSLESLGSDISKQTELLVLSAFHRNDDHKGFPNGEDGAFGELGLGRVHNVTPNDVGIVGFVGSDGKKVGPAEGEYGYKKTTVATDEYYPPMEQRTPWSFLNVMLVMDVGAGVVERVGMGKVLVRVIVNHKNTVPSPGLRWKEFVLG